jgi:hypothetical protein
MMPMYGVLLDEIYFKLGGIFPVICNYVPLTLGTLQYMIISICSLNRLFVLVGNPAKKKVKMVGRNAFPISFLGQGNRIVKHFAQVRCSLYCHLCVYGNQYYHTWIYIFPGATTDRKRRSEYRSECHLGRSEVRSKAERWRLSFGTRRRAPKSSVSN